MWAAVAHAGDPTPKAVDIKAYKDKLAVVKDADGGIYVFINEAGERHVFFGMARDKKLYEQMLEGGGRNGKAWTMSVQAPRASYPFMGSFGMREDGTFYLTCGSADVLDRELTLVTGDKAKEIIEKWSFLTTASIRRPYLLARDDRGVYYYVDMLREIYGGAGHRVYVGKKGALKQMALTDVTSDSGGDVFSTKTGDLRLVKTTPENEKPTAEWIRGEKKSALIYLDTYMNQPLIFKELGIYKIPNMVCGNL